MFSEFHLEYYYFEDHPCAAVVSSAIASKSIISYSDRNKNRN